jgi:hypothetical protein
MTPIDRKNTLALISFLVGLVKPVLVLGMVSIGVSISLPLGPFSPLIPLVPAVAAIVASQSALARAKCFPPGQAWRGCAITGLVLGNLELIAVVIFDVYILCHVA